MKVSVIIPIYKVEEFIERCATSLFEQTLSDVEYIFVDDATPDRSILILQEILDRFPERKGYVHFLHHEINRGLPAARNTGLALASGDYIFHCDSDDYLEIDMLRTMVEEADKCEADFVYCDWWLSYKKNERLMSEPKCVSSEQALRMMLRGGMKYNVWNKLIRRDVYEKSKIRFPEGYGLGEDMTIIKLLASSKRVLYINKAFYHYVQFNSSSFTSTSLSRNIDVLMHNTESVIAFIRSCFGAEYEMDISCFLLHVKLPLLISFDKEDYTLWESMFKDAHVAIWKNDRMSLRIRLLQWAASKRLWWFVKFHNFVIYRMVYANLYK